MRDIASAGGCTYNFVFRMSRLGAAYYLYVYT